MAVGGRSVFISYRRQLSETLALLVSRDLTEHKFDTFMDTENLDSGKFEQKILGQIEAREHFIVLLEPGSLDGIGEKGDWLRREIAYALAHGRNVVPVTAKGFEFGGDLVLPPDVAELPSFQAVSIKSGYYPEGLKRLRKRFLKTPSRPAATPLPETRSVFKRLEPDRSPFVITPERLSNAKFSVPVLPAPKLTSRAASPVGSVQLTWSEVSGAQEYVLEIARVKALYGRHPKTFDEVYRGPNRSYYIAAPPGGVTGDLFFHYRVRASISGQAGEWSNTVLIML
jgi:hypothetical protein